jgi:uncharacterized damage-inducible protein DinB
MDLKNAVQLVFLQLSDSLARLSPEQYHYECRNLSGNSVGQHVRHIIEMFQCLDAGYQTGEVDYENRKRDRTIETDRDFALGLLIEIIHQVSRDNKKLHLLTYYDDQHSPPEKIETNFFREVAYNLEHTIHHMALIRVALKEIGTVVVDESYGVASSTLKYRSQCAQ